MSVWESADERLWDQEQETVERTEEVKWAVLHPGDTRVWLSHTTKSGAVEYVNRNPGVRLLRQRVEIETTTTYHDWEIQQ